MIIISERAAGRLAEIRQNDAIGENVPLRIGVAGGGCSGLTYQLDFEKEELPAGTKDKEFESNGVRIVVDMRSFLYLAGTELDYTDGFEGKGFHFVNPNATRTCSCGESFAV
ncbi:MAG: iron-sulfur cluster assembly accessory protein [Rhodothermaceae bacterium]|nr:iron-sulfur cluster assembly accessory protein [Rhodothermaceae bacterium]